MAIRPLLFVSVVSMSSCASIDHTSSSNQPLNKPLLAGPGDLVLRVDLERNLENAFGKADFFGRKTKEGYTEIRYAGVEPTGEIVLFRRDVQIITNETTMSRTPITATNGNASTTVSGSSRSFGNVTNFDESVTTNYSATTLAPASDYHIVIPSDAVALRLAPNEMRLPMSGFVIEIVSATRNALEYEVRKME